MSTQIVGHDFALLPALLAQAGMADLIPEANDEPPRIAPSPCADGEDVELPCLAFAADGGSDPRTIAPLPALLALPAPESPEPSGSNTADFPGPDDLDSAHDPDGEGAVISRLLAELAAAAGVLGQLAGRDEQERQAALQDLARYDAAVAARDEARHAGKRAAHLRAKAERLAATAYGESVRVEAAHIVELAQRAEAEAERCVQAQQERMQALAAEPSIQRALDERQRQEHAQRAAVEGEARVRRRADALSTARMAAAAGWLADARAALAAVAEENPGDAEIATLLAEIAEREAGARVAAAHAALHAVRHELRDDPSAAVARLEALAVDGLPHRLSCHVFNAWSRACLRLCRAQGIAGALRLSPRQGRGLVLVPRGATGRYVIFSVLGLATPWEAGRLVADSLVAHAAPLRR